MYQEDENGNPHLNERKILIIQSTSGWSALGSVSLGLGMIGIFIPPFSLSLSS